MIIIQGQAKATGDHPTFQAESIHSIVAIVNTSSPEEAGEKIKDELAKSGFGEIRLFRFAGIPLWRSILLNEQGRNLRAALLVPVVNVYTDDDVEWRGSEA